MRIPMALKRVRRIDKNILGLSLLLHLVAGKVEFLIRWTPCFIWRSFSATTRIDMNFLKSLILVSVIALSRAASTNASAPASPESAAAAIAGIVNKKHITSPTKGSDAINRVFATSGK